MVPDRVHRGIWYMKPVKVLIVGAGSRGMCHAEFATQHPDRMKVVGVAEPRDFYRNAMAAKHDIPRDYVVSDWTELAERKRFADAVIISTQDSMHVEPSLAFARLGYHLLLEKPMAPDESGCRKIVRAVKRHDVIFSVCHVLRYTEYTRTLKRLIQEGRIGDVVCIQHLEPVGYWHQAHSFVRGNWRNEATSSPMLLAKSCHDLDWLRYLMGVPCERVSSFGSLTHFRPEEQPAGAADRCLDCRVEATCPYSARKLYLGMLTNGRTCWPLDVVTPDLTREGITKALREGPYGRCVYACDNDVVDHQVVNFEFEGGRTASFTMTAFTEHGNRRTTIFGTRGEIRGDGKTLAVFDFLTDKTEVVEANQADGSLTGGHGGGDYWIKDAFVRAVATGDRSGIRSGPDETLESHLMVFAAEKARMQGRVVPVKQ
ncbi:MAG: oxidoreductase [Lentisphaerae bacterium RIFOXYC12_FULL_60_16]|nr:MAG: oxidoreductase [Lentisphaerae bacterium RIFOXYC12_FULL_60_16]